MHSSPAAPPLRSGLTVAILFFLVAIALSGILPLWLDEIIQLRNTRNTTPAQLVALLPQQPGAAPFGYLVQQTVLHTTGYSVRWARFPSALFMAGTVLVVGILSSELGAAKPWIAAAIFALFPVTLRYASESRIYSQALFFASLATLLFVRGMKRPGRLLTTAYCLALTAAIYTQPFAIFVGLAHVAWSVLFRERKAATLSALAAALAIASFLPWYLWSRSIWSAGIAGAGIHFSFSVKTPLMLFREVAGAGYWGSGLLVMLCALAAFKAVAGHRDRVVFLSLLIAIPVALVLVADGMSNYFVATRQIIWVLPAIALLAAKAVGDKPRVAVPVAALLAALCLWQSIRFFTEPKENWQIAADALVSEVKPDVCLVVVPPEQQPSYEFFRPELAQSHCPSPRTVVAFTPYATVSQRESVVSALSSRGYTRQHAIDAGKSEVALFSR
jgi:hypothetical protein